MHVWVIFEIPTIKIYVMLVVFDTSRHKFNKEKIKYASLMHNKSVLEFYSLFMALYGMNAWKYSTFPKIIWHPYIYI